MRSLVLLGLLAANFLFAEPTLIGISYDGRLYGIDSQTGAGTLVGNSGVFALNALASDNAGNLFSAGGGGAPSSANLYRLDPISGLATLIAPLDFGGEPISIRALTFTPDGILYGINDNTIIGMSLPDDLYTIDPLTGKGVLIGSTGMPGIQGLEYSPDGILYGWDVGSTGFGLGLVTINPLTGQGTDINFNAYGEANIQTLAFAPDGNLYGARDALYRIDVTSGAVTIIGSGSYSDLRGIAMISEPRPAALMLLAGLFTVVWYARRIAAHRKRL